MSAPEKNMIYSGNVNISKIKADTDWNIRKDYNAPGVLAKDELEKASPKEKREAVELKEYGDSSGLTLTKLAASMKASGQVTPVVLRPMEKPDKEGREYLLVSGFRRLEAAKSLGWTQIRAEVRNLSEEEAAVVNWLENDARKDLTPYERSMAALTFQKRYGWTSKMMQGKLGIARKYIDNLLRFQRELHPEILRAWSGSGPGGGVCTQANLKSWVKQDKDVQLQAFREARGEKATSGANGGGNGTGSQAGQERPKPTRNRDHLMPIFDLAKKGASAAKPGSPERTRLSGIAEALSYVLRNTDAIPGLVEPETKKEKAKDDEDDDEIDLPPEVVKDLADKAAKVRASKARA